METRLLTISSDNAVPGTGATATNFTVDLGNNTSDLAANIVGVSVESVGFTNLLPNVRPGWALGYQRNGIRQVIEIEGNKFYSIYKLAEKLHQGFDDTSPGLVTVSVEEDVNSDGGPLLKFQVEDVGAPENISVFADGELAFVVGIQEELVLADGGPQPYLPVYTRTNLNGEQAVMLHTRQVTGSRSGIDGRGRSAPVMATIPITQPYGSIQTLHLIGDNLPTTVYGPMTRFDLNGVDISLRYLDGTPAFVDNTKMFVTFRLWLVSK
jgi:hypothetical protein